MASTGNTGKATGAIEWLAQRRKAIVAAVGIAIGIATQLGLESNKWVQLAIALATLLGLYAVPNKSRRKAVAGDAVPLAGPRA